MNVTLVDSPVANVANIERALVASGAQVRRTSEPAAVAGSRKLVVPGVGSFAAAVGWLDRSGVGAAIRDAVEGGAALLGVCVGHQVLFEGSTEMGEHRGLGFLEGRVERFETSLPIPQIGWNRVSFNGDALFEGIESGTPFYFVNSYRASDSTDAIARAEYGGVFVAAAKAGRVHGVQFHPEKSSDAGLRLLRNFVENVR